MDIELITNNYKKIWTLANRFKGQMNTNDFCDVLIGLIFYRIISGEIEIINNEYFEQKNELYLNVEELECTLKLKQEESLGYSISDDKLFKSTIKARCIYNDYLLEVLSENLYKISEQFGTSPYRIFYPVISNLRKFEIDKRKCNNLLFELMNFIDIYISEMTIKKDCNLAYIFGIIIEQISHEEGNYIGYCSPSSLSELIIKVIKTSKDTFKNIYDPTFGTGLLIINLVNSFRGVNIFGHEMNQSTYNIARMNMIVNKYDFSEVILGSSLDIDFCEDKKYDVVVSHPPFNLKWDNSEWMNRRYYKYVPPKNSANYAFILQMLRRLDDEGVMTVLLPNGVLFRDNVEKSIRADLLEKNLLESVIKLPEKLIYETNVPIYLLIFKKNKLDNNVIFINASSEFSKDKNKVFLSSSDINRIITIYQNREIIKGYSNVASLDDIRRNNYNLNIHKYIDIFGIDILMKNYNFSKYRLDRIAEISKYKGSEDQNYLIIRKNNPKVINNWDIVENKFNYISILPDEEYVHIDYLKYFFSTHISDMIFDSISMGVGKRISLLELRAMEIPIPKKEVQKKIVESQIQITNTINELTKYRDSLVNNPHRVDDLKFKLEELRSALKVNNRIDSIKKEISNGETLYVEFKKDFSSCENKIIKTIYAFLNSRGGKLYIGVDDNCQIVGLDNEVFTDTDDLVQRFKNKFRDKVPEYLSHVDIDVLNIDGKTVLLIICEKSKTPVFRKDKEGTHFFVRKFASTERIIDVEEIIKYVRNNFI